MSAAVSTPETRVHLRVLTNTEVRTMRRCQRERLYRYVQKRRPRREAEPLRFGTLQHRGLNAWHACTGSAEDRFCASVEAMRSVPDTDPFDLVRAEELMLGYTARWGEQPFDVVAVEKEFRAPLVNPETGAASKTYEIGGKLDLIVRVNARLAVVEHKTTSEDIGLGTEYWRRVATTDSQVSTYLSGARAAGYDVTHVIYDVIRKPGIRPLKATPVESRKYTKQGLLYANQRETDETPEEFRMRLRENIAEKPERYYARGEIVRLEQDERDHAYDMWGLARQIREAELAGRYPRNPDACLRFGRQCDYFPVCSGEASIEDDSLFRTSDVEHEELGEIG